MGETSARSKTTQDELVQAKCSKENVNLQESSLSTTFDELIRLDDEFVGENPRRKSGIRSQLLGFGVP
jgi:hypothetical protein